MCIRCRSAHAPGELAFCAPCALHARIEMNDGLRRLRHYLGSWAGFAEWLRDREGMAHPDADT